MATDAPTAGIRNPGSEIRSDTGTFTCHERAHVFDTAGVQHVARLDPAAACGADAEAHLPREPFGAVTVAVDRDRHAGGGGAPRDRAVHVEMTGRAIDLQRRAGGRSSFEHRLEIDVESGRPRG